jgi:hypothetical protein
VSTVVLVRERVASTMGAAEVTFTVPAAAPTSLRNREYQRRQLRRILLVSALF